MKPLTDPIRSGWKHDFYQSVDFDRSLWRKVQRNTEDLVSVRNRIGAEIHDQLMDEIMDHIVTFSSFFSLWQFTNFDHGFYNRFSIDHNGSFSSFFWDW